MHKISNISWQLQTLEETDSTNRAAAAKVMERWAAGRSSEGIAILARRQTAGRGQHDRRWESPNGGLYLSAVLENVPPDLRPRIALAAGVAVAATLEPHLPLQIRWPNDLVTPPTPSAPHGKKIAGILCEALAQGPRWAVIVGIGINVQTRIADLPEHLQPAATSLAAEGFQLAIKPVARELLPRLARVVQAPLAEIISQVRARDALRGKAIELADGPHTLTGMAAGIADNGGLVIDTGHQCITAERGTVSLPT